MIPPRPRDNIELTGRCLEGCQSPREEIINSIDVIVGVGIHRSQFKLSRCLESIAAQKMGKHKLGVVILFDQVDKEIPQLKIPPVLEECTWIVRANCGSAARTRNTILSFVDTNIPVAKWIARLDWDDRFASDISLFSAIKRGEDENALFVLGGNRVLSRDGEALRLNPAEDYLLCPDRVLAQLKEMADGTAFNEVPSCNLVLRTHAGFRYPDTASAEDHWLVANLLINHAGRAAILPEPLLTDYTLDGDVTVSAKRLERYYNVRKTLYNAANTWRTVKNLPGRILGLGQEGIIRKYDGIAYKHFYPGILKEEKVTWLCKALKDVYPFLPEPVFQRGDNSESWIMTYPWEETREAMFISIEQARKFLLFCLKKRLVCANIKRANFRITNSGQITFVDIGNDIIPMDVSYFRDASARLYSISTLKQPDDELLRRKADHSKPEIWNTLSGFSDFYGNLITEYADSHWRKITEPPSPLIPRRNVDVSLLIKACAMDAEYARDQIIHIVDQLVGPQDFAERVVLIDQFQGPFLRQHATGDFDSLIKTVRELKEKGIVDRILIAPNDSTTATQVNQTWFGIICDGTHSIKGVPVIPQLWGFEQIQTKYVLQCDIDVLIGRRDPTHDYLADMLTACRPEGVLGVAFNIPHELADGWRDYDAPPGEYVPEVRCGLLDLHRMLSCHPLPNSQIDNRLSLTWYRSLQKHQKSTGFRTLRGGDPATFYIHPPNTRKDDLATLGRIRDIVAQGLIPQEQIERWDLEAPDASWQYPKRYEEIVVLARGRNTEKEKLERFAKSLAMQDDQSFGVIVIDDASDTSSPRYTHDTLRWLGERLTLVRQSERKGPALNQMFAIRELCTNPQSLIVILDLDDAFLDRTTIRRIKELKQEGYDVILAAPFRPDVPTKIYHPTFDNLLDTYGGDVWIHLRSFKKDLFDQVPDEAFKICGNWLMQLSDYASMIPVVELAKKPIYIPEYMYWHERNTVSDEKQCFERDSIIEKILSKSGERTC